MANFTATKNRKTVKVMGKTILIVDDSESIRELVSFTLKKAGHNVLKAIDGQDALKYIGKEEIHLIITDLHMPVMNGIELIKKVRKIEECKRIPILFLTTESQKERKLQAKEAGATGWIIKPFVPAKLIAALNRVLR